jgi:uncharacterized protein (TIGR03435 family)
MPHLNIRNPKCIPRKLLPFAVAIILSLSASAAHAQLAHKGPAAAIALSKTLQPYDAISIRQNDTGADNGGWNVDDHGLFTMNNMPLESVIEFAYDIKSDQIIGLTGPVSSARFNVSAKVLPPDGGPAPLLPDENLQAMAILMLEDRFNLKAHLQPKIMPVYDLVTTHGGLKIKLSQDEIKDSNWNINGADTEKILTGKNSSMADLADALSDLAGRKVIDKTGLTGHGDITLKWTDDVAAEQGGSNVISIFTAVEEQLGLKLQPSKGPVDTLVIDHAEMPTGN